MNTNGRHMSDEYAGAIVDTRGRIFHNSRGPVLSMHIPQTTIAKTFVKHFGVGEVDTYEHPASGKVFNEIVLEGEDMLAVLRRVHPHLISRRFDADIILEREEQ